MDYEYGGAYREYPVDDYTFPDGSRLAVHDLLGGVPDWMREADLLFADPPWNQGNLRCFYTKNGAVCEHTYEEFCAALFRAVGDIGPRTAYIEVGKEHLADFIISMRALYPHVTFYNSSYYHKTDNHCYVIRGSRKARSPKLDGMDEQNIIEWVCVNEDYECIADPCMGQGLVALYASRAGKRFVGIDINAKRLAVARKRVERHGA